MDSVTEEGNYKRRTYFCNWYLQAVYDNILDPKLTFFTEEAWFHWSGYINAQKVDTGAVLIQDRRLKCPFMTRSRTHTF
jgi:hypothetical protein